MLTLGDVDGKEIQENLRYIAGVAKLEAGFLDIHIYQKPTKIYRGKNITN